MMTPSDSVVRTFVQTDIKGSSNLLDAFPELAGKAITEHYQLLKPIFAEHGKIFSEPGDGIKAAFESNAHAVEAVTTAMLAINAYKWPPECPIKIRASLTRGTATPLGTNYQGATLSVLERLCALAHPGQIVMTASVARPDDAKPLAKECVAPIGPVTIEKPSRHLDLFQVVHPDLCRDFPPLIGTVTPTNLKPEVGLCYRSKAETDNVVKLLLGQGPGGGSGWRLVTLHAGGGVGKTFFATHIGHRVRNEFRGGVYFIDGAGVGDRLKVDEAIADAMNLPVGPTEPARKVVQNYIADHPVLLILDNCESLINEFAAAARPLLDRCPNLRVLATSQVRLGLEGERVFNVARFAVPARPFSQSLPDLQAAGIAAVDFFLAATVGMGSRFAPSLPDHGPAVAEICHLLDGIPMALSEVAGWFDIRSLAEVLDNVREITAYDGPRADDVTAVGRVMAATIRRSVELLDPAVAEVFLRASAFAQGWTRDALVRVMPATLPTVKALETLVRRALVEAEMGHDNNPRFRLLEPNRLFARDELASRPADRDDTRDRHLDYFLALARKGSRLLEGSDQNVWLDRFDVEYQNVLAALDWCRQSPDRTPKALDMLGSLWRFWWVRPHAATGLEQFRHFLALAAPDDVTEAHAKALNAAAYLEYSRNALAAAKRLAEHAFAIRRRNQNWEGVARSLTVLGLVAEASDGHAEADRRHRAGLRLCDRKQLVDWKPTCLNNLGLVHTKLGQWEPARARLNAALDLWTRGGDDWGQATALQSLTKLELDTGNPAAAAAHLLNNFRIAQNRKNPVHVICSLEYVAQTAIALNQSTDDLRFAARLIGVAKQTRDSSNFPRTPIEAEAFRVASHAAVAALGQASFDTEVFAGCTIALNDAIDRMISWLDRVTAAG